MTAALFVLVNGLSSSTNQRSHTGHGTVWLRETKRQTRATITKTETAPRIIQSGDSIFIYSVRSIPIILMDVRTYMCVENL